MLSITEGGMNDDAAKFLERFLDSNVHISAYVEPTEEDAERLASDCRSEALSEGISADDLEAAAGDDLVGFIHEALMSAYNNEMARVRDKD